MQTRTVSGIERDVYVEIGGVMLVTIYGCLCISPTTVTNIDSTQITNDLSNFFEQQKCYMSNICPEVQSSRSYFSPTFLPWKVSEIFEHSQISDRPLLLFLRGENAFENSLLGDIRKRGRRKTETSGQKAGRFKRENRQITWKFKKAFREA